MLKEDITGTIKVILPWVLYACAHINIYTNLMNETTNNQNEYTIPKLMARLAPSFSPSPSLRRILIQTFVLIPCHVRNICCKLVNEERKKNVLTEGQCLCHRAHHRIYTFMLAHHLIFVRISCQNRWIIGYC